ncbi:uncharacterized protein BDW70DRAFT_139379 [Aspergillus foveolatus]|uniref:uncharacterized protein n=1 Tax=Aspergillus foveolatus TaxID=210207 RepID=UPI003CCD396F
MFRRNMAVAQTRTSIRRLLKASGVNAQHRSLSAQIRRLWTCPHQYHNSNDLHRKHTRLIYHNYHRSQRPHHPPRSQRIIYPNDQYQSWRSPGWGWGWGWGGFNSSFFGVQDKPTRHRYRRDNDKGGWEDRVKRRMEWIKKEIEADPYAALFGRRPQPLGLNWGNKLESGLMSLWRSVFGLAEDMSNTNKGKGAKVVDSTLKVREASARASVNEDMSNTDTDKCAKVIDSTLKVRDDSGRASVGEEVREPMTRDKDMQRRSSTDFRGAGFEFDPISGRMVPVRSEPWGMPEERGKERLGDGQFVENESIPVGDDLPREKAEADSNNLSEPNVVDFTTQKDSTVSESSERFQGASEPSIVSESQIYASAPTQEASNCLDETVQATKDGIHAQVERSVPPQNDSHDAVSPATVPSTQSSYSQKHNVTERPLAEHSVSKAGPDRAGFLSRRENGVPKLVTGESQPYTAVDNRDEDIELLNARDIRAAYEPRRLSIEAEIEAETPKQLDEPLASQTDLEDTHGKSPVNKIGDSINMPVEPTASTSSTLPDGQALNEGLLQHEPSTATTQSSVTETYRIFAYDPSSAKVTEAETISSLQQPSELLHPTEVLTRLANPAKFLPCLNQMNAKGYEIVSGGGDILVFRKAPAGSLKTIDRLASPTKEHSTESAQPPYKDVQGGNLFDQDAPSKQSRKSPQKATVTKVLRRMLVGGLATGGTCYALGVVSEYFRTGGKDGFGIDGFTEFESERRHLER